MTDAAKTEIHPLKEWLLKSDGPVLMTVVQALVRLPLVQKERDQKAGLNTGGFISGYRGSPIGGYDSLIYKTRKHLESANVIF